MKLNLNKKRNIVLTIVSNLIIVMCIFSVFEMCFGHTVTTSTTTNGAYYSGNKKNPNVSLMVNVYWGTEYLDDMLSTFEKYNVKTTFFVGGYWVAKNEDMLNKIIDKGHEIGNHGYFHKDQDKLSLEQNIKEISMNHQAVLDASGYEMKLFAPPSGAYNKNTILAAENLGYKTIMWSKDTIDWRDKNTELIISRATKNMSNGDLILMHPTEHTVKALEKIITTYQNVGFNLTTVSENISYS